MNNMISELLQSEKLIYESKSDLNVSTTPKGTRTFVPLIKTNLNATLQSNKTAIK